MVSSCVMLCGLLPKSAVTAMEFSSMFVVSNSLRFWVY